MNAWEALGALSGKHWSIGKIYACTPTCLVFWHCKKRSRKTPHVEGGNYLIQSLSLSLSLSLIHILFGLNMKVKMIADRQNKLFMRTKCINLR